MDRKAWDIIVVFLVCVAACITTGVALVDSGGGYSLPVTPGGPHEGLCLDSSQVNSSTNATLNLTNCSSPGYTITMVSYYVKSGQNVYNSPSWSGPTMPVGAHASVNIMIDGNAFKFQSGYYYEIDIVTQRARYSFAITA